MISSNSDARIESIETYSEEYIYADQLDWAITDDITRAYEGEFYQPLTDEEQNYWEQQKDDYFHSTRSTLARNSTDFWIKSAEIDGKGLRGEFEAQCHQNPVKLQEGDEVFRILMYQEEDRLNKTETERNAEEILQQGYEEDLVTPEGILNIPIEKDLSLHETETSLEELERDKDRFISYESDGREDNRFQLMETAPVSMPDDVFGKIRDTTQKGSYHINSVTVDPEYEGGVVLEVIQPFTDREYAKDDEHLEMELYDKTEMSKKTENQLNIKEVIGV